MNTVGRQINRREALAGTGLVGAGAVAALLSGCTVGSADASTGGSSALEGAWLEEVTFEDGSPPVQALALYSKDGGVVTASTLPPGLFSPGFGAWAAVGNNQFRITFMLFAFETSGQSAGIWRARTLATVDHTNDLMSGRSSLEFQAAGGTAFAPRGAQRITGSRIKTLSA